MRSYFAAKAEVETDGFSESNWKDSKKFSKLIANDLCQIKSDFL